MIESRSIQVFTPGLMEYQTALTVQQKLLKLRQRGEIGDVLLLLEHPPVITLGKSAAEDNVLLPLETLRQKGITVHKISRGGDVTYHGPGQIVGYPVFDLNQHGRDIHRFVRNLEEVFIQLLSQEYGIEAGIDPEYTGVWVENNKITAIGLTIKRWVSMHGFAFNVNTDLEHFNWIVPCGITDKGVTSLQELTGRPHDLNQVIELVADYFSLVFDCPRSKGDQGLLNKLIGGNNHGSA